MSWCCHSWKPSCGKICGRLEEWSAVGGFQCYCRACLENIGISVCQEGSGGFKAKNLLIFKGLWLSRDAVKRPSARWNGVKTDAVEMSSGNRQPRLWHGANKKVVQRCCAGWSAANTEARLQRH